MTDSAPKPKFDQTLVERTTFEKEAIWLPFFAVNHMNAGQTPIAGKTFTDCLFEGPAVLAMVENVNFDSCNMGVSDDARNLQMMPVGERMTGVIAIKDCEFIRCRFVGVAFTGDPEFMRTMVAHVKTVGGKA